MFNNNLRETIKNCPKSGDWWGVRSYSETTQFRMARNGQNAKNQTGTDQGVMVEVLLDGQFGYGATSDLSMAGLTRAFERASTNARAAKKFGLYQFDESVRPKATGSYSSPYLTAIEELTPALVQERLMKASKDLHSNEAIIEANAWAMITKTNISYLSSNGSDWTQDFSIVTRDMSATAKAGEVVQSRSIGMQGRQWGAEALDENFLKESSQRVAKQVMELLEAPECPEDTRDLIISPDQLYLQVHESIGHPLELDRILGDERNYAGWSFVSPEDFGSLRYGPEILNVSFDPGLAGEMASYAFDDNGVKAEKELLIDKGILKRGIGGIESQTRSGIAGVSCARATSWNRPAIDRMGNINIEPGESSIDDMIKSTERGVLMETNRSWSIDDYRNKFQFGCEYGRVIKDGELGGVVRNPNYRGSTVQFWNSLSHVGNQDSFEVWGSPYCGKGEPNQVIRVGHAIPTCKFTDIQVFGGA